MPFYTACTVAVFLFHLVVNVQVITSAASPRFLTCGPQELASCTKSLTDFMNSGFTTSVSEKEDLQRMCVDLTESVKCISIYTRLCMNIAERKHFRKLFRVTELVVRDLCHNATYQDEYLLHVPCMASTVAVEGDNCLSSYTEAVNQVTEVNQLCCALDEYKNCKIETISGVCGNNTASFFENFLYKMDSTMLQEHCIDIVTAKKVIQVMELL